MSERKNMATAGLQSKSFPATSRKVEISDRLTKTRLFLAGIKEEAEGWIERADPEELNFPWSKAKSVLDSLDTAFFGIKDIPPSLEVLKDEVAEVLDNFESMLNDLSTSRNVGRNSRSYYDNSSEDFQMTTFLSTITAAVGYFSRRSRDSITDFARFLVQKHATEIVGEAEPSIISHVLAQLPSTVRATVNSLKIDIQTTQYAVCDQCNCTFGPKVDSGSSRTSYPGACSNRPSPGTGICGAQLTDDDDKPKKSFLYYEFRDYLASLYLRQDLEKVLDDSADKFKAARAIADTFDSTDLVTDVFQGDFFGQFVTSGAIPDVSTLFLTRNGVESRLVFSLHVNFSSVNGVLIQGSSASRRTTSRGIIAMACLNLPPDIRYKVENIYVAGIIPGPKEPALTELNHFMKPLIDDLVVAFSPGIFLSTTSLHPSGRLIRCAIGPIVCNLPAGHKLLQLTSHTSSKYCSACTLTGESTWGRSDYPWIERSAADMRCAAERWLNATSKKEAEEITNLHGVRYTELWRLPYLNPTKQLIVDPMHSFFKGIVEKHFLEVLKLKAPAEPQPISYQFRASAEDMIGLSDKDKTQIAEIHRLLLGPWDSSEKPALLTKLNKYNISSLSFLCRDLNLDAGLQRGGRILKLQWAQALADWRMEQLFVNPDKYASSPAAMARIRAVIHDSTVPSWLKKPRNFGKASTAHEWMMLCMLYIPIALISLWGVATEHESKRTSDRYRKVLNHTMLLSSSARLVCQTYTNKDCAERYLENIRKYVHNLRVVHPNASFVPNHHMSFHIYDSLRLFGPAPSWWTYPFEQMMDQLPRIRTNRRPDQLEQTILKTYIRTSKLRRWLGSTGNSPVIFEIGEMLDKFYPSLGVGKSTELNLDNSDSSSVRASAVVPSPLRTLLGTRQVQLHEKHTVNGVIFTDSLCHPGNSQVMFRPPYDTLQPIPGIIKYIYQLRDGVIRYAIQRLLRFGAGDVDQYAIYEDFPAQRYSSQLGVLEIIDPSCVQSHFLRWKEDDDHVVIIPVKPNDV